MKISNRLHSLSMLILSLLLIVYMLFMLIIVPILPLDEDNMLAFISQTPILVVSGVSGLIFCGSLSVFTIYIMSKGKWHNFFKTRMEKIS